MSFITARLRSQSTPKIREKAVAVGQVFSLGALLLVDSNGAYAECGADPAAIAAVAESDFGPDLSGFNRLNVSGFPPGYMQATSIESEQAFHAEYVGALPAAPGGSYGVVRDTDGRWKVDFGETTATRLKYVKPWGEAPLNRNRVVVIFLPSVVQVLD